MVVAIRREYSSRMEDYPEYYPETYPQDEPLGD